MAWETSPSSAWKADVNRSKSLWLKAQLKQQGIHAVVLSHFLLVNWAPK